MACEYRTRIESVCLEPNSYLKWKSQVIYKYPTSHFVSLCWVGSASDHDSQHTEKPICPTMSHPLMPSTLHMQGKLHAKKAWFILNPILNSLACSFGFCKRRKCQYSELFSHSLEQYPLHKVSRGKDTPGGLKLAPSATSSDIFHNHSEQSPVPLFTTSQHKLEHWAGTTDMLTVQNAGGGSQGVQGVHFSALLVWGKKGWIIQTLTPFSSRKRPTSKDKCNVVSQWCKTCLYFRIDGGSDSSEGAFYVHRSPDMHYCSTLLTIWSLRTIHILAYPTQMEHTRAKAASQSYGSRTTKTPLPL